MKPNILLIGCGNFGRNHLRILKQFHQDEKINLKGVVVATEKSQKRIEKIEHVSAYTELSDFLLEKVDGVDIVTPVETHYEIAKKCIKHSNLLVEKPLTLNEEELIDLIKLEKKYNKKIMAGHIYRFTNTLPEIKKTIQSLKEKPYFVECKFIGAGLPTKKCGALQEFLHPFDILDYLIGEVPKTVYCTRSKINSITNFEEHAVLLVEYNKTKASIEIGWAGKEKQRNLILRMGNINIYCDLLSSDIKIFKEKETVINCDYVEPLKKEIEQFLDVVNNLKYDYPNTELSLRIQKNINLAYKSMQLGEVIK